jgi:hypothetical protein
MINSFFNIFRKNKTVNKSNETKSNKSKLKNKTIKKNPNKPSKKVRFNISIQQIGNFSNEQDCLQELKKTENKGGKCRLLSVGSYTIEKETRVKK